MKTSILVVAAIIISAYIGYSDLSQTDTLITVALILAASSLLGCLVSSKAWAYALIIGLGVPVAGFLAVYLQWHISGLEHGQIVRWDPTYPEVWVSMITILLAMAGAYIGQGFRRLFNPIKVY